MFLAKVATLVLAFILVVGTLVSAGGRQRRTKRGEICVESLNDHLQDLRDSVREEILDKATLKTETKARDKQDKKDDKEAARKAKAKEKARIKTAGKESSNGSDRSDASGQAERRKRVYVLAFDGDIEASEVESLREEITAVLSVAEAHDEVVLRLESPGGVVHGYGLAASQLQRIKEAKVPLTICVDKVAASGGYMMACLADRLVAAPFSIIGSIGVVIQLPNFHKILKKNDVDYEVISAGEYKRTLSTFGEISDKGRAKAQEDVETIHDIFKQWVKTHRPSVDVTQVATGETWVGMQAKEKYLIDELNTSDAVLLRACSEADVFEVSYKVKQSLQEKLGAVVELSLTKVVNRVLATDRSRDFY